LIFIRFVLVGACF
jgi:diacylglycerol kinase (ATP)